MGFIENSENETIQEVVQEQNEKTNEETTPVEQEEVEVEKGE